MSTAYSFDAHSEGPSALLAIVGLLTACGDEGGDSPAAMPTSPTVTATPSPSPSESFDFCGDLGQIGDVVRSVRKGTETEEEQIASIDALQDSVQTNAETVSDPEAAKALRKVGDALRRFQVAIDAVGPNYRYDPVVKLTGKTVSFTGLSAALALDCPDLA